MIESLKALKRDLEHAGLTVSAATVQKAITEVMRPQKDRNTIIRDAMEAVSVGGRTYPNRLRSMMTHYAAQTAIDSADGVDLVARAAADRKVLEAAAKREGEAAMTTAEMKAWIGTATYQQLLSKWRFAAAGSLWFQGEVGKYYAATMKRKWAETPHDEQVAASKAIGWGD